MKIVIQTNADFTPKGKRSAKIVKTARGSNQLRWYVGNRRYWSMVVNMATIATTQEWLKA